MKSDPPEFAMLLYVFIYNVHHAGRTGWSAFTTAADLGKESIVRLFYDYGIDLDVLDGNKWSALHAAARRGEHLYQLLL